MYDSDGDRLFYLANESSSSSDVSLFNKLAERLSSVRLEVSGVNLIARVAS
jgi:hypothetical protein